jgi:hypothetical protein
LIHEAAAREVCAAAFRYVGRDVTSNERNVPLLEYEEQAVERWDQEDGAVVAATPAPAIATPEMNALRPTSFPLLRFITALY